MPQRILTGNSDRAKRTLLFALSLSISFVILELGLRLFTPFPIHGDEANRVRHPVLGYTLDPTNREIDAAGFRNPTADGPYEIVAIGDSHTQGFNATSAQSWPYQLADRLNVKVYNFGIGGYGIYHYPYLAERAAEKSPSLVLLALYPANDLKPPKRLAWDYLTGIRNVDTRYLADTEKKPLPRPRRSFGTALKSNSAIASVAAYLATKAETSSNGFYDVGGHTIKKARIAGHQSYTDLSDAAIRSSFHNSLNILSNIKNDLGKVKIKFGVVIIPSKELVIHDWALGNDVPVPDGVRIGNERALIKAYMEFFAESGIRFTDATPFVLEAFQSDAKLGRTFYPRGNGHPLANGYRSYADAAAALVEQLEAGSAP
jgi:hypothetical protein